MTRNDYLNPDTMREQCRGAVRRMEENNHILETVSGSIERFAADPETASQSFCALKRQLEGYQTIIEAMKIANDMDIRDFKRLDALLGDEVLDGNVIFCQIENALRLKESYLSGEAVLRSRMIAAEEPLLYFYYSQKAERYRYLAGNSQSLCEQWKRKAETYDTVMERTNHLFADSRSIGGLIQKGLAELSGAFKNGAYIVNRDSVWIKLIKNECLRFKMCFGDKGGDQNGPYFLWQRGIEADREYIRKLVHGYEEYEGYSDEEIGKLLMKLKDEGCGYTAFANIIVDQYRNEEEEFEKLFGFSLFLENANGISYVNYNQLILDLYCASDNHDAGGLYISDEDISETAGIGTTPENRVYRFENYMKNHGAEVEICNIECSVDRVYERCKEETAEGHRLIVSTCPVRLTNAAGEPVWMDGAHAMTVTGLTDDGKIEVSSWGEKYFLAPEEPDYATPGKNGTPEAYIKLQAVRFR